MHLKQWFPTFFCHSLLLGAECSGASGAPSMGNDSFVHGIASIAPCSPHLGHDLTLGTVDLELSFVMH